MVSKYTRNTDESTLYYIIFELIGFEHSIQITLSARETQYMHYLADEAGILTYKTDGASDKIISFERKGYTEDSFNKIKNLNSSQEIIADTKIISKNKENIDGDIFCYITFELKNFVRKTIRATIDRTGCIWKVIRAF